MTSASIDPLRLNVATFAADARELDGDWAIADLPRLAASECPTDAALANPAEAAGLGSGGGVDRGSGAGAGDESGAGSARTGAESSRASSDLARRVRWRAVGSERRVGGQPQTWLWLRADADVVLQCQRCLLPINEAVHVDRHFRFVDDEASAAALDDEMEDDVLVLQKSMNLRELVEDEMLLALPLVPRHAVCAQPLPMSFGDIEIVESETAHPFAALAALRKDGDGGAELP